MCNKYTVKWAPLCLLPAERKLDALVDKTINVLDVECGYPVMLGVVSKLSNKSHSN